MLICFWYGKIRKNDSEDKDIIDRKSLLDNISCEKLYSLLLSKPLIDESIEHECKGYPYSRPSERFFHRDFFTFFMKDSEIECKHK